MMLDSLNKFVLVVVVAILSAHILHRLQQVILFHSQGALDRKRTYQETMDDFRNDPQRFRGRGTAPGRFPFVTSLANGVRFPYTEHHAISEQSQIEAAERAKENMQRLQRTGPGQPQFDLRTIDQSANDAARELSSNKFWLDAASRRATGMPLPEEISQNIYSPRQPPSFSKYRRGGTYRMMGDVNR